MRLASLLCCAPALGVTALVVAAQTARAQGAARARPPGAEWTLDDVLAAAMDQHPLIEAARARVSAAEGTRRTVGALPNPVATYQVENAGFPGQRTPAGLDREISTFVTLPLEALYQRWPRVRRADEDVKAAEASLTTARRQVALDAARAFYRVALAQVSVDVAEQTRVGLARLASYNRSRVTEGAAAEGDLIRVQVELERAETNVALEEVELARSRAELAPCLGDTVANVLAFDSLRVAVPNPAPAETSAAVPPAAELVSRARQGRPELLAARARVAAAGAEAGYQRALTVRQVGATFGTKRINGENSMIAGVSLPLPLFDQNHGEVQRATAERVVAEQELAWTERTVTAQVQAAHEAAERLSAQVAKLQGSFLDRAEEAHRITLTAYEEGAASLLQVLDASRTLGEARLTYYRALFAQRQSVLDLAVAAGSDPAPTLTTPQSSRTASPAGPQSDRR